MQLDILKEVKPLTEVVRNEAREKAKELTRKNAGTEPQRRDFHQRTISAYPSWLTKLILFGLAIVFISAFILSIFRVFTAGRDYFLHSIPDPIQAAFAGAALITLAEFMIIVSTLTRRVYFNNAKWILVFPALGMSIAIVGNWVVTEPYTVFGYLDTLAPPFSVLGMAIIWEAIIFKALEHRRENERLYQEAYNSWVAITENPENDPSFVRIFANVLRDRIRQYNAKYAQINDLTLHEWRILVSREMQTEDWFDKVVSLPQPEEVIVSAEPGGTALAVPLAPTATNSYGFKPNLSSKSLEG